MRRFSLALVALVVTLPALAADRRFPEAKSGKGELKYVNGMPVLTLEGTPEEIGAQFGELALNPAKKPLIGRVDSYMQQIAGDKLFPAMVKSAWLVYAMFADQNTVDVAP